MKKKKTRKKRLNKGIKILFLTNRKLKMKQKKN